LFLTPDNTSNSYEVTVSRTDVLTSSEPNNIITLAGREFTITAIIIAGTPGKIRLTPRFVVNTSETILADSQWCVVEGCQPFALTAWPFPCPIDVAGQPVYCAADGLRTVPKMPSAFGGITFAQNSDIGGIETLGTYSRTQISHVINNPSSCYTSVVHGTIEYVDSYTLDDDGSWDQQLLYNENIVPTTVRRSIRVASQNGERRIDSQIVVGFYVAIPPGGSTSLNILPRLVCVNASANTNLAWTSTTGEITYIVSAA